MDNYIKKIEVRWADLDPNFHMLHSRYYDLGGFCRMAFLVEHGLTPELMQQLHIGPILFREECIFKREICFTAEIVVNIKLKKSTADFSRWTLQHEIWKNGDTLSAVIVCEGAWLDTRIRRLTVPTEVIQKVFDTVPKSTDFTIYTKD